MNTVEHPLRIEGGHYHQRKVGATAKVEKRELINPRIPRR